MLIDDLKERLKSLEPDITLVKKFWENSALDSEYSSLKEQIHQPDFWKNKEQASISQRFERVKEQRSSYHATINTYQEFIDLVDLFENDELELKKIEVDVAEFVRRLKKFKISLLLSDPEDQNNCFLDINAGAGGTESQDWANILLRMYLRFCEDNKLQASTADYQSGEEAGIKSATLYIKGKNAYGLLKSEHGVHRLVRISPFDSNKRRHTSFASISITPEYEEVAEINLDPKNLRIDTYRASGAGGQHVNKTESAVRITHLPTNTVVQCQNERSQIQNRETAMKMLKARLLQKQKDEERTQQEAKQEKKRIEWGSQIRSYVLHPYKMVKDHRTGHESPQPDIVLDGDLMPFIEHFLIS
jgi:peptide chain release factor 2